MPVYVSSGLPEIVCASVRFKGVARYSLCQCTFQGDCQRQFVLVYVSRGLPEIVCASVRFKGVARDSLCQCTFQGGCQR